MNNEPTPTESSEGAIQRAVNLTVEADNIFKTLCADYCAKPTDKLMAKFYLGYFESVDAYIEERMLNMTVREYKQDLKNPPDSVEEKFARYTCGLDGVNYYPSRFGGFHVFNSWDVVAEAE